MVVVKIFIEGGIVPHLNDNAITIANSERLREAFKKLFMNAIDENKFRIEIELMGGYSKTIEKFKANYSSSSLLLIDLDDSEDNRNEKVIFYELNGFEDSIFFMIQKMEAWMLSQLDNVDKLLSLNYIKEEVTTLSNDESVNNKLPSSFRHPDAILNTLIARYFIAQKGNKKIKLKYGKLKLAPQIIEVLDIKKLQKDFIDVKNIINKITTIKHY